ncbi:MAG: DUF481 domain-containing protein [SAR324 cluster bacterium]|nr:DUF481 domain-containing protein [SAR324 cluster bacterium]
MKTKILLASIIALLWASSASAIVNIENQKALWPKKGTSGALSLSFSQTEGNTESLDADFSSKIDFVGDENRSFIIVKRYYAETSNLASDDTSFAHLRFIFSYHNWLAYEAFLQAGRSPFLSQTLRQLAGGGLRFLVAGSNASYAQFLGIGAFLEQEKYDDGSTREDILLTRANIYWRFKLAEDKDKFSLNNTVYFQPALIDAENYRLSNDFKWEYKATDTLSFFLSLAWKKDNQPWGSNQAVDSTVKNGLKYSF